MTFLLLALKSHAFVVVMITKLLRLYYLKNGAIDIIFQIREDLENKGFEINKMYRIVHL